jgi:hypothetical protein
MFYFQVSGKFHAGFVWQIAKPVIHLTSVTSDLCKEPA